MSPLKRLPEIKCPRTGRPEIDALTVGQVEALAETAGASQWDEYASARNRLEVLVMAYMVPIGNALLHLNVTAAHPFANGNSHLRLALSTARTIANTHPLVAASVVDTIATRWDGFFSGYA